MLFIAIISGTVYCATKFVVVTGLLSCTMCCDGSQWWSVQAIMTSEGRQMRLAPNDETGWRRSSAMIVSQCHSKQLIVAVCDCYLFALKLPNSVFIYLFHWLDLIYLLLNTWRNFLYIYCCRYVLTTEWRIAEVLTSIDFTLFKIGSLLKFFLFQFI